MELWVSLKSSENEVVNSLIIRRGDDLKGKLSKVNDILYKSALKKVFHF